MNLRQRIACAALVGCFIVFGNEVTLATDVRAQLERKDFTAETYARMLVVLTAASGQHTLAQCMHDRYFGSPLLLRRTLWEVWNGPSRDFAPSLLEVTKSACSQASPEITASDRQTWLRTATESILLEVGKPAIGPAIDMIVAYERMRGVQTSAQCAQDEATRTQAERLASDNMHKSRLPVSLAVYDTYRTLCSLNPNGPTAGDIVLPAMPDVPTVARERLLILQDFVMCQNAGGAHEDACVEQAYKTRSKQLFNQLLTSDSRN